jgi:hypothetical protein
MMFSLRARKHVWSTMVGLLLASLPAGAQGWAQWGLNAQHTSTTNVVGQTAQTILEDIVYDPFVAAEQADPLAGNDLLVHYQVPLINGDNVFMEFKSGNFTSVSHWETQTWNEKRLHWEHGHLVEKWSFQSDWKPVPYGSLKSGPGWEPVFHAALAPNNVIYIPGLGGTIFKVNQTTGAQVARLNPFGTTIDPNSFTHGPLTVDNAGNVYYNVSKFVNGQAFNADVVNSWLVKVTPAGVAQAVTYASLNPGAPAGNDKCLGVFNQNQLPWPPSPTAVPPMITCGSQRPGLNSAPAVAPDGTIYNVTSAHFSSRTAYILAVNPNLTPKWVTSLRDRLTDGCNVLLPPNGQPNGCRVGAATGVDPAQNRPGAGRIIDDSTAAPIVAPDGSVFIGVYTRYNWAQGHLMKFSATGAYLGAYQFGWDTTPGIRVHDGSYSVITKENHYSDGGSYCDVEAYCPGDRNSVPGSPEVYYLTQLDPNFNVQWQWQNTNTQSCSRDAGGNVTCVSDHPHGFEFCVNAPAIDSLGNVYNNSEDGNLYVVDANGNLRENIFLKLAVGAAYTPLSIGSDGKIYTQNAGHLFVVGR